MKKLEKMYKTIEEKYTKKINRKEEKLQIKNKLLIQTFWSGFLH